MSTATAPILSTPAEHVFEEAIPAAVPSSESRLSEEQLHVQYEIQRTVREIRDGRWRRIALQFPDEMLVDAPRVFERLRDGLRKERKAAQQQRPAELDDGTAETTAALDKTQVSGDGKQDVEGGEEERLCILADTSYGACCVDEVAAEHVDAEVVVHYGRACLSPTARLPVIYVFTTPPLDLDAAVASFMEIYPEKTEKVCLMADIPYSHHVPALHQRLIEEGYENIFATEVVRDPSSLLPNRTIPSEAMQDPEALKGYSVFHIASPPTSLLLILSSRVKRIHIFPASPTTSTQTPTSLALEATTHQLLRRRYALLTRLSTVLIFGILINTLSVSNYMAALTHCQNLISRAGKKFYVFVVGKVNAAKIANFGEIGGWVVIGCWESSLVESKDFFRPIITPFELEVALKGDGERVWGGEWVGDFGALLGREDESAEDVSAEDVHHTNGAAEEQRSSGGDDKLSDDDDEPPEFDLRTGRYVSRTRPMGRARPASATSAATTSNDNHTSPPSSAVVQRAKGDIATTTINGTVSPAAEFLRSQRTWQGLGSDYEIAYERDEDGRIRGAAMEEGRSGVARGYAVGGEEVKS